MALPALKLELEDPVEERLARLETNVEHIQSDISDMKVDIRRLNDKVDGIDQKLTAKIDGLDEKLTTKIDDLDKGLTAKIDDVDKRLTAKIDDVDKKLTGKIDAVDQKLTGKIDTVDQKLTGKIDTVDQKLSGKIDGLKDSTANLALTIEKGFADLKVARALDRVWWLLMSAASLGIMARAFKWI